MPLVLSLLRLLPLLLPLVLATSDSIPVSSSPAPVQPQALTGRFIHLTDFHPDPFYVAGASEQGSCHSAKPDKGRRAGYWGLPVSDCDAPLTLVNATITWLSTHFKDKVDFVVWTGDNARHDIDSRVPRSIKEIFRLNRFMLEMIREAFGRDVVVVASIGNNASAITTGFLDIWSDLIPEDQTHNFARGGYYSIPVLSSRLLLISLNTLYMYDSNKAVDGCPDFSSHAKDDIDPGTEELAWLEQQLLGARERGAQVWLTGHVPPTKGNWYPGCYRKYGELMLRFQDSILGNLFGHMNEDHFSLIDSRDVIPSSSKSPRHLSPRRIHIAGGAPDDLRDDYRDLPSSKKIRERDFSVVNINPSVIPTYLPAVRVWMYNISGEAWRQGRGVAEEGEENEDEEEEDEEREGAGEGSLSQRLGRSWTTTSNSLASLLDFTRSLTAARSSLPLFLLQRFTSSTLLDPPSSPPSSSTSHPHSKSKKLKHKKKKKKHPTPLPRHSSPLSPSRMNRFLTPLGYTQYYMNLTLANLNDGYGPSLPSSLGQHQHQHQNKNKNKTKEATRPSPPFEIEYVTFGAEKLAKEILGAGDQVSSIPRELLPPGVLSALESLEAGSASELGSGDGPRQGEGEGEGEGDKVEMKVERLARALREEKGGEMVPYEMEDLTVGKWLDLARTLGESRKAWRGFRRRLVVGSGED